MQNAQYRTHSSITPPGQRTKGRGGERKPIDVFVGQRLLTRRLDLGLSHDDLAAAIHMPSSRIAAYERGEERIPPAHLIRFTDLLGVKLPFFFLGA
jgi:ribosome-binding protein aMBF1 (putative translation factor)